MAVEQEERYHAILMQVQNCRVLFCMTLVEHPLIIVGARVV